ncbi:CDP-diacylglycerol--glycerol-3-phosphate 3-phosphatidyltransferase [Candidatus Westeberhardia cardiocondylae]|uniref:CDP-diacylglycerol--glycerol-3-phosphate 3-phosphatidyltransferase n=1 Tax=Candidatus Westeberhardia cardiocondylae TaxID=1594731 RepID=A0A0H5BWX2_9ENTR|nr:CDP-diacylglycerol--glycerol-3-phosphate 3-phosphatidyltransferase [Candidatus Westeberhardia cardiocondylae]CEN32193.1 CDP-diacylglycerol--glycerol-3-phosphate 3-phosphatidyltransferase [Candidatus Westeberhardia cardiocondylae]
MQFNLPILLTLFRIIMVPFFILTFYLPFQSASFFCIILFIAASLTDWFDGFLARRWKQTTKFGTFLDIIADKIMIITALILIVDRFHLWYITLSASIIIIREMLIAFIRAWIAEFTPRNVILISKISKIKTSFQMFSLIILLCKNIIAEEIGFNLLFTATLLTFLTMLQYLYIVWRDIINH